MIDCRHVSIGCLEAELIELVAHQRVVARQLEQISKRAPSPAIAAIHQTQMANLRMIEALDAAQAVMVEEGA